jgi:hypothetical protein
MARLRTAHFCCLRGQVCRGQALRDLVLGGMPSTINPAIWLSWLSGGVSLARGVVFVAPRRSRSTQVALCCGRRDVWPRPLLPWSRRHGFDAAESSLKAAEIKHERAVSIEAGPSDGTSASSSSGSFRLCLRTLGRDDDARVDGVFFHARMVMLVMLMNAIALANEVSTTCQAFPAIIAVG